VSIKHARQKAGALNVGICSLEIQIITLNQLIKRCFFWIIDSRIK
jgi:hypothetical protein